MTKRLYYPDTGADELNCQARVLACQPVEGGGYDILLDQTVIYPEGGGQKSDTGCLLQLPEKTVLAQITHAREEGEEVWHRSERPILPDTQVLVKADAERRRDHSVQHSGEHILSGLACRLFEAKNVGFHMAEDYSTLDLDIFLSEEQLLALQRAANQAVQSDTPTRIQVVEAEALDEMELRKKAKGLTGTVRVLYIGGVDSCTCCGTHVSRAGEIGFIRIDASMKYKGGIRIWFSCGMRAVEAALQEKCILDKLAHRFSTKVAELPEAVYRQGDALAACKREMRRRTAALLEYQAKDLLASAEKFGGVRLAAAFLENMDMGELKLLAEKLCREEGVIALLLSRQAGSLHYQLARSANVQESMKEFCLIMNGLTGGRGGGRDDLAQGSAPAAASSRPEEILESMRAYCRQRFLG